MGDAIDRYLEAYDKMKAAEAEYQSAKEVKATTEIELVAYLSSLGLDSASRGDRGVRISHTTYGRVKDFGTARSWVLKQGEPINEYMEEVFKKKVLNRLAREAQAESIRTGVPVEVLMPDGTGVYINTVVTVRKRSVKQVETQEKAEKSAAQAKLDAIMEDF